MCKAWPGGREETKSGSPVPPRDQVASCAPLRWREKIGWSILGTGTLTLHDLEGRPRAVLARRFTGRYDQPCAGETKERDLSWHDWSVPRDISDDGKLVSFDETGEAGGETGGLYVRGTEVRRQYGWATVERQLYLRMGSGRWRSMLPFDVT